jgi:uncharacterized membrane protein
MVFMYLLCAALNTLGVFGADDATRAPIAQVKDVLLPAMIFLFLFGCDLRKIIRLGPKLLLTFFVASASLSAGMVIVYAAFQNAVHTEAWKVFGALLASWTGGSANMVAVQDILQAPENIFGYALITDTIGYSVWLMLMFASVAISPRFNRWTKANTSYLEDRGAADLEDEKHPITVASLSVVVFGAIAVSTLSIWIGGLLPEYGAVINGTTWSILIVSLLGLVVAITLAPVYLLMGALVLLFHAAVMVLYAKLTRTELFSLAVASTANVGGIASAPVVAAAFNKQLVPVGVLYALIGSFMGTFVGLAAAQIMSAL